MEQHHLSHSFQYDGLSTFLDMRTVTYSKQSGYCYLPFHAMWAVWKAMNLCIFERKKVPVISILHQIAYSSQLFCPPVTKAKNTRPKGPGLVLVYPCGFFDGASAKNYGGVGFCLYLNESHSFEFALGAGLSTNTRAELLGLFCILPK